MRNMYMITYMDFSTPTQPLSVSELSSSCVLLRKLSFKSFPKPLLELHRESPTLFFIPILASLISL